MASGHVNRIKRPNTWPHRPNCDVKKVLANRSRPHMAHNVIEWVYRYVCCLGKTGSH